MIKIISYVEPKSYFPFIHVLDIKKKTVKNAICTQMKTMNLINSSLKLEKTNSRKNDIIIKNKHYFKLINPL